MPIVQQNSATSVTTLQAIQGALEEIGVLAEGEAVTPGLSSVALPRLQRWVDQVNARRELIFSVSFLQFTLTANHAPHTIGPNGDFNLPVRPVRIQSGAFLLNSGSQTVDMPIKIRDSDWWAGNPVKSLQSSIVTHLYYDPASPLGNINFWPICTLGNPVRLELWNSITVPLVLQSTLSLPQGYWDAMVLSLAKKCAPLFGMSVSPDLREDHNKAMRIIEANNDGPPRINTDDGSPNNRKGGRPDFNFLTGLRE